MATAPAPTRPTQVVSYSPLDPYAAHSIRSANTDFSDKIYGIPFTNGEATMYPIDYPDGFFSEDKDEETGEYLHPNHYTKRPWERDETARARRLALEFFYNANQHPAKRIRFAMDEETGKQIGIQTNVMPYTVTAFAAAGPRPVQPKSVVLKPGDVGYEPSDTFKLENPSEV